jgi:hypothetical protein
MPKTLQHKDFIGLYDEALTEQECADIILAFNNHEQNSPEIICDGVKHFGSELKRKDYSTFADQHLPEIHNLISNKLHDCLLLYCDQYFTIRDLNAVSRVVKLQRTPPRGGYHVWHCEQDSFAQAPRVLVWTIYLNDVPPHEGETEFLWQGLRVNPKAGRCAIWPATFTHVHRGNPVYTHDKYIATGWYLLTE